MHALAHAPNDRCLREVIDFIFTMTGPCVMRSAKWKIPALNGFQIWVNRICQHCSLWALSLSLSCDVCASTIKFDAKWLNWQFFFVLLFVVSCNFSVSTSSRCTAHTHRYTTISRHSSEKLTCALTTCCFQLFSISESSLSPFLTISILNICYHHWLHLTINELADGNAFPSRFRMNNKKYWNANCWLQPHWTHSHYARTCTCEWMDDIIDSDDSWGMLTFAMLRHLANWICFVYFDFPMHTNTERLCSDNHPNTK